MLPDLSVLIGQKLVENAKIKKLKFDILGDFQTLCSGGKCLKKSHFMKSTGAYLINFGVKIQMLINVSFRRQVKTNLESAFECIEFVLLSFFNPMGFFFGVGQQRNKKSPPSVLYFQTYWPA